MSHVSFVFLHLHILYDLILCELRLQDINIETIMFNKLCNIEK